MQLAADERNLETKNSTLNKGGLTSGCDFFEKDLIQLPMDQNKTGRVNLKNSVKN